MDLETVATSRRLRFTKLEDGEAVIPLRGFKKSARYPSNGPHAGIWDHDHWYALVPCKLTNRCAGSALSHDTTLTPVISDGAVIMLGPQDAILSLITKGPKTFRCFTRRKLSPDHAAKLSQANSNYRFSASE
jgi:hypothetical protein